MEEGTNPEGIKAQLASTVTALTANLKDLENGLDVGDIEGMNEAEAVSAFTKCFDKLDTIMGRIHVVKEKFMDLKSAIGLLREAEPVNETQDKEPLSEESLLRDIAVNEDKLRALGMSASFIDAAKNVTIEFLDWGDQFIENRPRGAIALMTNMERMVVLRTIRKSKADAESDDAIKRTPSGDTIKRAPSDDGGNAPSDDAGNSD